VQMKNRKLKFGAAIVGFVTSKPFEAVSSSCIVDKCMLWSAVILQVLVAKAVRVLAPKAQPPPLPPPFLPQYYFSAVQWA